MKLWILEKKRFADYDSYNAFVVRAKNEEDARQIAYKNAADEGGETWINPEYSTCTELLVEGKSELILGSFRAG